LHFGTGEPARLYRLEPDGTVVLLATLTQAHLTTLLPRPDGLLLATANPATVHRLGSRSSAPAEFLSAPVDAGGPARWGRLRWVPAEAEGTEFFTRTGNRRVPDATWSAWSPALRDGSGSRIVNPDGRYLQWRVRQTAGPGAGVDLSRITLSFEPYNRPPSLVRFAPEEPAPAFRGPVTLRWEADDPDGDPVRVEVEQRAVTGTEWAPVGSWVGTARIGRLTWNTESLEEGGYVLRARGTDQPGNPRGEGRRAGRGEELLLVIDRSPPQMRLRRAGGRVLELAVEDDHSPLARLEIVRDGAVRFTLRPEDGVCDSRREIFRVELPAEDAAGWIARGTDAAGNLEELPLTAKDGAD
jgi:hypothetical protein